MKRKISRYINNRRFMAGLAAFLFAFDMVITMMASNAGLFSANAAVMTVSLGAMRSRAEELINYEWIPSSNIMTWNNTLYNGRNYFKKGEPVYGIPFTLFTYELNIKSQCNLGIYKNVASKNYSASAVCKSRANQKRVGPAYGSCCAAFVSEVMAGQFMGINVASIDACRWAKHVYKAKPKDIKVGDAFSKGTHVIWIGDITDEYYVIYEQTPPVARKMVVRKDECVASDGRFCYNKGCYGTLTRYNVTGTTLPVTAPQASSTHQYYAENAVATVSWPAVKNASFYLVDVIKDGETVVSEEVVTSRSYEVNKGNGDYEVYVTAVSGYETAKSESVSFSIGKLDTPVITSPAEYNASGEDITVEWNESRGATGYHLSISMNDNEQIVSTDLKSTSYTFTPEDGYYEVRVEAKNDNGGSQRASSDIYSFFVGNKRLIAIDSTEKYFAHDGEVPLMWNECEGVSDYTLVISSDGTECLNETVSGTHSYVAKNLPDGQYKAVVSAVESTGEYEWMPSKAYSFYVGKLDQPVVSADTKYHEVDSRASVSWQKCAGAVGYHIVVTSQDAVVYEDDLSGTRCSFDVEKGKYSVTVTAVNTNGGYQECQSEPIDVWAVSLDIEGSVQVLNPGDTAELRAVASGHDPADSVKWTTSQPNVITVANGTIVAEGAGVATIKAHLGDLSASYTVSVDPGLSFETLGASIRIAEPYGIRFGLRVEKDEAFNSVEIVEYGTLLIGAGTLGDADLTVDTKDVLKIKAEKFLENTSSHITYTGVLINIPDTFFNTDVVGRGYLKYRGADGETYTLYSTKVVRSFCGVLYAAYDSYKAIEEPTASQQAILQKLQELVDLCTPETEESEEGESEGGLAPPEEQPA